MIKSSELKLSENMKMAKPRIFVSSSYYDLKYIRSSLQQFIESFGYEAILFERGDFLIGHENKIDESCYKEIPTANMLILIIGSRYGSGTSAEISSSEEQKKFFTEYNSVTRKELQTAIDEQIPVFIFIDKNVSVEYQTYKKNRDLKNTQQINYAHVESINVYIMLDEIFTKRGSTTWVQPFERFDDISSWLRNQWASMFTDYLKQKREQQALESINSKISSLDAVVHSLKTYSEAIMKATNVPDVEQVIEKSDKTIKFSNLVYDSDFFLKDLTMVTPVDVIAKLPQLENAFLTAESYEDFVDNVVEICDYPDPQFQELNKKMIRDLFANKEIRAKYIGHKYWD